MGFVRPGVGAIPPIAEMQAMLWVGIITGKVEIPLPLMQRPIAEIFANRVHGVVLGAGDPPKEDYHLLQSKKSRIQYGVDHGA